MTQPAKRDLGKPVPAKDDEGYDFPESSDLCDFGYALIRREDAAQLDS